LWVPVPINKKVITNDFIVDILQKYEDENQVILGCFISNFGPDDSANEYYAEYDGENFSNEQYRLTKF